MVNNGFTKFYNAVFFFTREVPRWLTKPGQRVVSCRLIFCEAQRRQRDGPIRFAPEPGKAYIYSYYING